jgi:general secretion pathway protein E
LASVPRNSPRLPLDQRLALEPVLAALVADGELSGDAARRIRADAGSEQRLSLHPLVLVANQHLTRGEEEPLDLEWLTRWLAAEAGLDYMRIDPMDVDVEAVTGLISQAYARQYRILPVAVTLEEVVVATSEPFLLTWMADLAQILRREIKLTVASPLDISRFLEEFYGVSRSVKRATDLNLRPDSEKVLNFEQLLKLGDAGKLAADDQHVVYIVDWLLQYAFDQRASDIHLEPRRESSKVRFRIDGQLHEVYHMPAPVMSAVTSRIKILGRMDVAEKRRPQDGRLKTVAPGGQEVELRLSTMPTAFGEKCVMRIFDPQVVAKSFKELGFSPKELMSWRRMVERPHGIVLVTGPTGSGKTTTLYSTLKHLARPELNICTIEDPIEMVSPAFNQMQVQSSLGVDFASGVRTLLRQDPDIIMIGEVRDLETAQMAIQASLTGHLVLSTLHTNDAPSAIVRLLDLGVPHYLIKGSVVGIVAQRLVRTLCPKCKCEGELELSDWQVLVEGRPLPPPDHPQRAVGCDDCRNTGYRGRSAIYEMMELEQEITRMIDPGVELAELTRKALEKGMMPLRLAGARKVAQGLTNVEEVARVVPPRDDGRH